jgi:hypothetical protein
MHDCLLNKPLLLACIVAASLVPVYQAQIEIIKVVVA